MQKRIITIILAVCAAALAALTVFIYMYADRTGPVITFADENAEYTDGETNEELLTGVTAADDEDGDVSNTLRVISVIKSTDGTQATVVYTAKDSSHNITRKNRVMHVAGTASADSNAAGAEVESGVNNTDAAAQQAAADSAAQAAAAESAAQAQAEAEAAAQAQAEADAQAAAQAQAAQQAADPEAQAVAEEQAAIAALPAGSPSITLSPHYVTLSRGATFSYMSYVSSLTDDRDNQSRLAQRIELGGDTVNTNQPGTYNVIYQVRDTSGNASNQAVLHVTVE